MQESGQLKFIQKIEKPFIEQSELGFGILFVDGHTDKQMLPHINYKEKTLVFAADLVPTAGHIPVPYVMGYDTRPLLSMEEKHLFMENAVANEYLLFLEHDAHNEICALRNTERGVRLDQKYTFNEIFN